MAHNTINTILRRGAAANNMSQLARIKSTPQLGGEPEQIEATDLQDRQQTFVPGVESVDSFTFVCNYTPESYDAVKATAGIPGFYQLIFAQHSAFQWQGEHNVYVNGTEVNGLIEMTITVTPSTEVTKMTTVPATGLAAGFAEPLGASAEIEGEAKGKAGKQAA